MPRETHPLSTHRVQQHRHSVRRLRDVLLSNIVHGAYRETKMPTEAELMERHAAPRAVVREALSSLRRDGLIDRLQGYGTYAMQAPQIHGLVDTHGISHEARSGVWELVTHTSVLSRRVVSTPDAVAKLMPDVGGQCYEFDYLTHHGDEIIGVGTNYFRFPEAEAIQSLTIGTDFYEFLTKSGLEVGASRFTIGASIVDETLAETLGVGQRTPLLMLEQVVYNMRAEPFDVAFIWLRADRIMLNSFAANPGYPTPSV